MINEPNSPQNFFQVGSASQDRYTNPFYNIPLQYMPQNMDGMLRWADHLLFRNGFMKEALNRIANYFITSVNIDCEDKEAKDKYQEALDQLNWKQICKVSGLNLLSFGNDFSTVNQGFNRYLTCPKCGRSTHIDKVHKFDFNKGKYSTTCLKCSYKGEHSCVDKPSNEVEKIHIVHWPAVEIKMRYEDSTGEAEYFWDMPQSYIRKVTSKNDKFFCKKTPKIIYDCIFSKHLLSFNSKNFLHLKLDNPTTIRTDGKSIPPVMFLFEDLFMYQTVKRYNEVICFEDIAPFRVFSMAPESNNAANPILHQSGGMWSSAIDSIINEHRRDPGAYHKVPFPLTYQQLGGEGKTLAPVDTMELYKNNILNALNIPVELYNMTLQAQAVGPALRLFENSWTCIPDNYNKLLNHIGKVISKILNLPAAKLSLMPVTFADDIERKSVVGQLVSANAIARSELLKMYQFDYEDQVRKKVEEDSISKKIQEEEAEKEQIAQQSQADIFSVLQGGQGQQGGVSAQGGQLTPQDALAQAQEIAQQLKPMDGPQRRAELQKIKGADEELYAQVKSQLEQLTSQDEKSGRDQGKQQQ